MTLDISRAPASVRAGLPKRTRIPKKPADPKAPKPLSIEEKRLLPQYFSELFLNRPQYKWCFNVLEALAPHGSRVALRASNGSGKTSEVVVVAVLWHMIRFPGSQTVLTAGVYRQLAEVLWPVLRNRINGMGPEIAQFFEVTENRIIYRSPSLPGEGPREPSLCNAFSAEKPESAEGWHARGPSQNLLYIIDEAKAVSDPIFGSAERCQPTRQLVVSSPGGRAGRFFEIFNKPDPRYKQFKVSAYDCPHLEKKWIDEQITAYGINSPIIQSMIFAEFGDEEGANLIVPPIVLQRALASPPAKQGSYVRAGVDFAAGGDESVAYVLNGNSVKDVFRNREKDTSATIGLLITFFKKNNLEPHQIYADAGGIGIPLCDALREAGWPVNRVNNGDKPNDPDKFANLGTENWVRFARLLETGKFILPADDEVLHRQLTTRHLEHNAKGKLMAEPKDRMKKRGLDSPDRADALILAACGGGMSAEEYVVKHGRSVTFGDIEDMIDDPGRAGAWAG
jgi:hypothetical protein